ncbi:MAG: hypothetical protein AAF443_00160 [Chlamydiota bacterium]
MLKLLPILKRFSKEVSGATKYFHFALWLVLFCLMLLIALSFSTDYPRSTAYRLMVGGSIWLGVSGILSLLFWFVPKKIIEYKKREGKDWSGVLTAANLALVKCAILPVCSFFVFALFCIHIFSESWVQPPSTVFGASKKQTEQQLSFVEQKREFEANLEKAKKGDPAAQVSVGYAYSKGLGVGQNKKEAVKYYRLAAKQKYAPAQYKLGFMYGNGTGVVQNKKKAVKYYRLAAEQHDVKAQYNLGCMYDNGTGVPQDHKKAIEYYTLAAEQGDASAQFNLALAYERGEGCEPNREKAIEYFTLAAEQEDVKAQCILMLIFGGFRTEGICKNRPIDNEAFLYWAAKATDNGETYPAYLLGDFFSFHGNKEKAIPFLQFAALKGDEWESRQAKEILKNYGRNFEDSPVEMLWAVLKGGKKGFENYKPKDWRHK